MSVCEDMFSYVCFDSAQFCIKTISMCNGATQQKGNLSSVIISGVIYKLLGMHHCCILYWAETLVPVLSCEQVFI